MGKNIKDDYIVEASDLRTFKIGVAITIIITILVMAIAIALAFLLFERKIDDLSHEVNPSEQTLEQYDNLAVECNIEGATTSVDVTYNEDYAVGTFRVYISTNEKFVMMSVYVDEELVYSRYTNVVLGREMLEYYYYPNKQIQVIIE